MLPSGKKGKMREGMGGSDSTTVGKQQKTDEEYCTLTFDYRQKASSAQAEIEE